MSKHQEYWHAPAVALMAWCGTEACAQRATVTFEDVPAGTQFGGSVGDSPGDLALTEGGLDIVLEPWVFRGGSFFQFAEVGGSSDFTFESTPLTLENIAIGIDFSGLSTPVTTLTIEYADFLATEFDTGVTLRVNGDDVQLDQLGEAPQELGDVAISFAETLVDGGSSLAHLQGTMTLEGSIQSLIIGGHQLGIDNVTVVPGPGTGAVVIGSLAWCRRRRLRP